MTGGKWTPGPWGVGKPAASSKRGKALSVRSKPLGGTVYVVAEAMRWDRDMPPETLEANARLIAAAPELARACEALLACEGSAAKGRCTYCGNRCRDGDNECPVNLARIALAKARGES